MFWNHYSINEAKIPEDLFCLLKEDVSFVQRSMGALPADRKKNIHLYTCFDMYNITFISTARILMPTCQGRREIPEGKCSSQSQAMKTYVHSLYSRDTQVSFVVVVVLKELP